MEQNEKIEKPAWVETVESLPEIVRQQVGATCAGCISTLVQIYLLHPGLFGDVIDAANKFIYDYRTSD